MLPVDSIFDANEPFFYHADGLGSVTDITDQSGNIVRAYVYDAFGRIVDEFGSLENIYTFAGRQFDDECGLYYYRARYYDPESGTFTQRDPIGVASGDVNFYRFVSNNPVNLVDLDGLSFTPSGYESFSSTGIPAIDDALNNLCGVPGVSRPPAASGFEPLESVSGGFIDLIKEQCRAPLAPGVSLGQNKLQEKIIRPGDKFSEPFGLEKGGKIPAPEQVDQVIVGNLTAPNMSITTQQNPTEMLPEGGMKIRMDGPESPGIALDPGFNFRNFIN